MRIVPLEHRLHPPDADLVMFSTDCFQLSAADRAFQHDFERGAVSPGDFTHRQHLRLAYTYLVQHGTVDAAHAAIRQAIQDFLQHHRVDAAHYHETLTRAWTEAVALFMQRCGNATSASAFLDASPVLLDSKALLTHYTPATLFSDAARQHFVPPDLVPIPTA
ncbi:MAG: hypothetical protein AAGJ10_14190 [Bacteroidota bacterium]